MVETMQEPNTTWTQHYRVLVRHAKDVKEGKLPADKKAVERALLFAVWVMQQ